MKYVSNIYAVTSLILANLVPLAGVWLWGWNVFSLMLLYWLESAIIGFFTIWKMKTAKGSPELISQVIHTKNHQSQTWEFTNLKNTPADLGATPGSNTTLVSNKLFFIPFFMFHYGLFMFVHLIFVLVIFFNPNISLWQLAISFASLFLSHFVSYQTNFINAGEYLKIGPEQLFLRPYPRIIVMHITIILGGILASVTNQSILALTLMVGLKIIADLGSHTFEHYIAQKGYKVTTA